MKKKTVLILAGILVIGGVVTGILIGKFKKEPEPEFVLTYAENQSEGYPTSQGAYYFADLVRERTDGRIKVLVYVNAELGREGDVITQMQYGGIDFARVSLSQLTDVDEKLNVLQLPFLYNDADSMWNVLDGTIGDDFLKDVEQYGIVGLSWYDAGARSFYTTNQPIRTVEDLKGLRIRVQQSDMMIDMVEELGATAVPLSYEEVYSALELGKIDGAENNWPSYEDTGHYRVAKYFCTDEHTRIPEMQLCSANTWSLLSKEDQDIIRECAELSAEYERNLWQEREKESSEKAREGGVIVNEISATEKQRFREKMVPIYEKYCSEYMDIVNQILEK